MEGELKSSLLSVLTLCSMLFMGCESNVEFEKTYPYAFLCDGSGTSLKCKETANPKIRYTSQELQALLEQMESMQFAYAQSGRMNDAIDLIFSHYAFGSPVKVKITKTEIPLLGSTRRALVRCSLGDFDKSIDNVADVLKDFSSYQIVENIEGMNFHYSLSVPKDEQKNDFVVFLLKESNAIILYSTSPNGDKHFTKMMEGM